MMLRVNWKLAGALSRIKVCHNMDTRGCMLDHLQVVAIAASGMWLLLQRLSLVWTRPLTSPTCLIIF